MDYNFTFPEEATGYLSPDNVHFFYYTIAKIELEKEACLYEWNDEIINYLNAKGIIIEEKNQGDIPTYYEKDKILFTIGKKVDGVKESKSMAFIRHLRNAFAHYHISEFNDYFLIKDCKNDSSPDEELTLIGKIKVKDLKEICFILQSNVENYKENSIIVNPEKL